MCLDNANFLWTSPGDESHNYDLSETDEFYYLKIDLPGVSSSKINVRIKDSQGDKSTVVITAKRENAKTPPFSGVPCCPSSEVIVERRWTGKFQKTVELMSKVDMDHVTADYVDGVLSVILHKERATFRDIIVNLHQE